MKPRQEELLQILRETGGWVSGKELARQLRVSDRTIRLDIEELRHEDRGKRIITSRRFGYRIGHQKASGEGDENADLKNSIFLNDFKNFPVTSGQRCHDILEMLLEKDGPVSIIDLETSLFYCNSSIEKDLANIRNMIKKSPGLTLKRSKGHLWLEGTEENKRLLCQKLLISNLGNNLLNLNRLSGAFPHVNLLEMWKDMEQEMAQSHYGIRKTMVSALATYMGISAERILGSHILPEPLNDGNYPENIRDRIEYEIADGFCRKLGKRLSLPVPDSEVLFLARFLMERQEFTPDEMERVDSMLGQVLELIYQDYHIDLRHDKELTRLLRHHIAVLLGRNWINDFEFPISQQEIKANYPMSFEIACFIADYLEENTGHIVVEREIGFIALHLQCAYERVYRNERYRILFISSCSPGLTDRCLERIRFQFGERAAVVNSLPMFEKEQVKKERPDLLLTTSPLKHELDIPTVQVTVFMNSRDEDQIFRALNRLDEESFRERYIPWIATLMKRKFFYTDLDADTPEAVVRRLCRDLKEAGFIPDGFEESVLEREKLSYTAFDYGFAFPHSMNMAADQSVLCVAFLKKMVTWGNYNVSLVLLPAVAREDRKRIQVIFNWLGDIITDKVRLEQLLRSKTWDEFQGFLQGGELCHLD